MCVCVELVLFNLQKKCHNMKHWDCLEVIVSAVNFYIQHELDARTSFWTFVSFTSSLLLIPFIKAPFLGSESPENKICQYLRLNSKQYIMICKPTFYYVLPQLSLLCIDVAVLSEMFAVLPSYRVRPLETPPTT